MHAWSAFHIYAQRGEDAAKWGGWNHALNSHGNYIVDHGKSWKNNGIVILNFCELHGSGCNTLSHSGLANF